MYHEFSLKIKLTRPLSSFKLKIVRKIFGSYSGSNIAVIRFLILTLSTAWLKDNENIYTITSQAKLVSLYHNLSVGLVFGLNCEIKIDVTTNYTG